MFQWLLELVIKWTMDDGELTSFLGPTMASAALALIAPVALPKHRNGTFARSRSDPHPVTFWALIGMLLGILGWSMCIVIGLKKKVPAQMAIYADYEIWQFAIAMALYCIAIWLVVWNERTS
ncbi:hypothetical protein [uncultured Methylibium sp.]|uniref:hypothetical protein n=1 Tax=uncultured Methylibium sp. TaxID=381093 RepID=UPI0025EE592C|nr:hypothetical protein [uncultured Methylibium sp.]